MSRRSSARPSTSAKTKKARAERERAEAKQKVAALAENYGFSVSELFSSSRGSKGSKVAVKYRNPDNSGETWTGRGRAPTHPDRGGEKIVIDAAFIERNIGDLVRNADLSRFIL